MPNYRRMRVRGAKVFFTVCLAQRGATLLTDEVEILREAVRVTRARRPFHIDAWVVLPDHVHAVWTLPEDDVNYSDRWGAIKARFSKMVRLKVAGRLYECARTVGCKPTLRGERSVGAPCRVGFQPTDPTVMRDARSPSKRSKQDAGIWQRRFWEHTIRDEADLAAHVRYCLLNPVKHGFVELPEDWPYSSIHRDIRAGRWEASEVKAVPEGQFSAVE